MFSQTEENYLKALYNLMQTQGEAGINEISKLLDIKMSTVNNMIKKLSDKGLVIYESYKPVKLTETGIKTAALIVRKHRLTEMFLAEKMGFGWEEVHEIAEQIEHIQSPKFFEKMDALLGYPTVDPHGSPIPDKSGFTPAQDYRCLNDCVPGAKVIFRAVNHSSDDLLRYLNSKNLELGTEIYVDHYEPYDDSFSISYGEKKGVIISGKVAAMLLVSND